MNRKKAFMILTTLCTANLFATSFNDLIELVLVNNSDIQIAQKDYDSALISTKTLNAVYAPSVSLSSLSSMPDGYSWDKSPDYFSSSVIYSQPLPGGTCLGLSVSYSFNVAERAEERYISQSPNISFSITQSLFPFWIQGQLKDPSKLSFTQQKNYYYNQLLYAKKTVIQSLVQYYAYAKIYRSKAEIYENSILFLNEQIKTFSNLKATGYINQAKITELETTKWNYQDELTSVQNSYKGYIQNLKILCGRNIDEEIFEDICEIKDCKVFDVILESIGISTDPLEENYKLKLNMLKTSSIIEKQNLAPTITLSVQPSWILEPTQQNKWKKTWKNINSPSSWSASVNLNLSPLITGFVKQNNKQFNIDYDSALKLYESYQKQKDFVLSQYQELYKQYKEQSENASKLYQESFGELKDFEKQYKAGAISQLDYDSLKIRVDNLYLSKKTIEMYVWMYEILIKMK